MNKSLTYSFEPAPVDVMTIEGIRYSGELFRSFGIAPIGALLRIVNRQDGVITVNRIAEPINAGGKTAYEMIAEWRKGCSMSPTGNPAACIDCTSALIEALEKLL